MDGLETRMDRLETEMKEHKELTIAILEQTATLTEFRTETKCKLFEMDSKLNVIFDELGRQHMEIEVLKKRPV